jgi:translation elongation factor EF-G
VRAAARACDGASEHVLVHVSKMFVNGQGEAAVGFARVYAGTLRRGQRLYVLGGGASTRRGGAAGNDAAAREGEGAPSADREVPEGTVMPYLMMGRDLLAVEAVPAGSLCALGGLGGVMIKSGTLCSEPGLPPFRPIWDATGTGAPIVRVAVEALRYLFIAVSVIVVVIVVIVSVVIGCCDCCAYGRPADMAALQAGLRQLNQADPSVEVSPIAYPPCASPLNPPCASPL